MFSYKKNKILYFLLVSYNFFYEISMHDDYFALSEVKIPFSLILSILDYGSYAFRGRKFVSVI